MMSYVLLDVCGGEEETTLVAVTLALPMLCFCSSIDEAMATEVGSDKGWNNISKTSENNKGLLGAGREILLTSSPYTCLPLLPTSDGAPKPKRNERKDVFQPII